MLNLTSVIPHSALSKQSKPKAPVISSSENEDVDVGMDDMMVETTKKPTKSVVKEPPVKASKTTSNQGRKKVLKKKGRPKKLTGTKNVVVGSQNDKGEKCTMFIFNTCILRVRPLRVCLAVIAEIIVAI